MSADDLDTAWDELQFGVRRSIRYHQRRRGFFERLDTLSSLLSVLFGSTVIVGVLAAHSTVLVLTASVLVTLVAGFNLVLGSVRRAWQHADLARRFTALERRLLAEPDAALLRELTAQRLLIEADEPPVLRVLDSLCHNELLRAQGQNAYRVRIGFWQRAFAQVFDLRADHIGQA